MKKKYKINFKKVKTIKDIKIILESLDFTVTASADEKIYQDMQHFLEEDGRV